MGTIRKLGKSWWIDYTVNGKRVRKRIGRSKKIAELALKDAEVQIAKGRAGFQTEKVSLKTFFQDYIDHINITISSLSTKRYKEIIQHFKSYLTSIEDPPHYLQEITPALLEKYKQSRIGKIANQTINYEIKVLRIALNFAIKMKLIKENPAKEVSRIRVVTKKLPRFLTREEIKKLLEVCTPDLKDIILLLVNTGIRLGELTHLNWGDIDLEKKVIRITAKENWIPKPNQEREIPLNEIAFKVLNKRDRGEGFIFTTKTIYARFKRACQKVEIESANLHTLRHTFASHLVMSGVDILTVSKLLGHSSVKMTEKYAHLAQGHSRQAVERLDFSGE